MKHLIGLLLAVTLAGCAAMEGRPPHRYYVLQPRATVVATAFADRVVASRTTAATFYDTQDIAFSREPGTRGYYQFSHWTERPHRVIQAELSARYGGGRDGYVLVTHLAEIYHDAAQAPGAARITLTAELTDRSRRTLLRRTFTRSAAAASHDAAGAVAAFDRASGELLDDVVRWVDSEVARLNAG